MGQLLRYKIFYKTFDLLINRKFKTLRLKKIKDDKISSFYFYVTIFMYGLVCFRKQSLRTNWIVLGYSIYVRIDFFRLQPLNIVLIVLGDSLYGQTNSYSRRYSSIHKYVAMIPKTSNIVRLEFSFYISTQENCLNAIL